ncbi:hypothetical protein CW304_16970 [Bacillus sp. UFRGS-B20]|nr:hypothetical protein CW304_16970 [Bacillus sp. UFRGS-B20]
MHIAILSKIHVSFYCLSFCTIWSNKKMILILTIFRMPFFEEQRISVVLACYHPPPPRRTLVIITQAFGFSIGKLFVNRNQKRRFLQLRCHFE